MKTILFSAAALAAVAVVPAIASTVPAPAGGPHSMAMNPVTRAETIQMVQDHFAKVDTNKDGFVTKEEADSKRVVIRKEIVEHRMEARGSMFERMDTDKNGSISRQEFDAAHQAMAARKGEHGRPGAGKMVMRHGGMMGNMFEMADANKDGKVSLQEATAAAAAHFDKADANRDGTLTPEERRAAHKAMRAKPSGA